MARRLAVDIVLCISVIGGMGRYDERESVTGASSFCVCDLVPATGRLSVVGGQCLRCF